MAIRAGTQLVATISKQLCVKNNSRCGLFGPVSMPFSDHQKALRRRDSEPIFTVQQSTLPACAGSEAVCDPVGSLPARLRWLSGRIMEKLNSVLFWVLRSPSAWGKCKHAPSDLRQAPGCGTVLWGQKKTGSRNGCGFGSVGHKERKEAGVALEPSKGSQAP